MPRHQRHLITLCQTMIVRLIQPSRWRGSLAPGYLSSTATKAFSRGSGGNGKESLDETVNRIKNDGRSKPETEEPSSSANDLLGSASGVWQSFSAEVGKTWQDLLNSGQRQDINKKINSAQQDDVETYDGPLEIMVIDESENLTAWERMQRRLTEAPIIQGRSDLKKRAQWIQNSV